MLLQGVLRSFFHLLRRERSSKPAWLLIRRVSLPLRGVTSRQLGTLLNLQGATADRQGFLSRPICLLRSGCGLKGHPRLRQEGHEKESESKTRRH
ncbi:MAG: hypothetical protein CMN03_04460 [Roseibacillus sp.]|nr:hypothetical protein [Roseibacillus sp.]